MVLPVNEVVYSPDGDIAYVKVCSSAGDSLRESIYEKVYFPPTQRKTASYLVSHRENGIRTTGTSPPFSALPPLIQKIFQVENRENLEALIRSQQIKGFVVKP